MDYDRLPMMTVTADGVTVKYEVQQMVDGVWTAMRQLGQAMTPAVAALRRYGAENWKSFLSAREQEIAFRRYAAHYTATHPRGLSWRRLNRPQRRAAAYEYWMTLQ